MQRDARILVRWTASACSRSALASGRGPRAGRCAAPAPPGSGRWLALRRPAPPRIPPPAPPKCDGRTARRSVSSSKATHYRGAIMSSGRTMASNSAVGDIAAADRFLAQGGAVLVRGLGDLGGIVVADLGRQRRHQHQRAVQPRLDVVQPRLDADHAIVGEAHRRVGHQPHALQEVIGHHRIVDVELEMALAAGEGQRRLVAEHLHADLGHAPRTGSD